MSKCEFDGEIYNDDRMFVMAICKSTVSEDSDCLTTTIHYKKIPINYKWCVVTFRNIPRYRAHRADSFETETEAREFLAQVEPLTPLVSLEGKRPSYPLVYDEYTKWKETNEFQEYDYKKMFPSDVECPQETIYQWKE